MKTTIELNVKEFGLQDAIAIAMKANKVEIIVSMPNEKIPFRCDWIASDKQIKGIADIIANVDNARVYLKYI